jgi:tetratricopeptide (TPR) repeat protein
MRRIASLSLLLTLLTARVAHAQEAEPTVEPRSVVAEELLGTLAQARDEDRRTEYARALTLYESYARGCLALSTAVLAREQPCADVARALERGFELAWALDDAPVAERLALAYVDHLLYAEPRRAMRIGYDLARMHLEAGRLEEAEVALDRWIELHPSPPVGHAILVDGARARIAMASGQAHRGASLWRRVERRYERERGELEPDGSLPPSLVAHVVAEGRLARADGYVQRFLATRAPRMRGVGEERWMRAITPWLVRTQRRLLLARMELERVYELGSPRHSVIAAARIGEMYGHAADVYAELRFPEEWARVWVTRGVERPGYDEALSHLETCVRWSHHHGVARTWAQRCERALNELDPERFPLPAELHGQAAYLPVQLVHPALPR